MFVRAQSQPLPPTASDACCVSVALSLSISWRQLAVARCGRCHATLELHGRTRADGTLARPGKENGRHLAPHAIQVPSAHTRACLCCVCVCVWWWSCGGACTAFTAYVRAHMPAAKAAAPQASFKELMRSLAAAYHHARAAATDASVGTPLAALTLNGP
jgi:hypothetical protein